MIFADYFSIVIPCDCDDFKNIRWKAVLVVLWVRMEAHLQMGLPLRPVYNSFFGSPTLNLPSSNPSLSTISINLSWEWSISIHWNQTSLQTPTTNHTEYPSMAPICSSSSAVSTALIMSVVVSFLMAASAGNFYQDFDITWGDGRGKILNNGELLTLSLDKPSGSGFQSKNEYLFGKIDMQLKLVPGNSAGTVTAYYVSSPFILVVAHHPPFDDMFSWLVCSSHSCMCVIAVIFTRANPWWNRLWIPGEPQWGPLYPPH